MKFKTGIILLSIITISLTTSCEKKDFSSYPPQFSEMSYKKIYAASGKLDDGIIRTGDKVVFTLVQSKFGKLLNKTEYTWNSTMTDGYQKTSIIRVIYDDDKSNPADTITAGSSGTYMINFKGTYNISGQPNGWNTNRTLTDGTNISYTSSGIYSFQVNASKKFTINNKIQQ